MSELQVPVPWERLPGESARSYGAFCVFRDIGARRSLRECCRRFYGDGSTANVRQISSWSSKWKWVDRCRAWDDHLDQQARAEQERLRKEMVQLHAQAARAAVEKALEAIRRTVPPDLKPADIIKWLVEAAKLERVSRGEPETIQEQRTDTHIHVDIFQEVEQYAALFRAGREQRLLASSVPGDGAQESLDQAQADGKAS
jgi:hypothetical protein